MKVKIILPKKLESQDLKLEGDREYRPKHKHVFDEQQEILDSVNLATNNANGANSPTSDEASNEKVFDRT